MFWAVPHRFAFLTISYSSLLDIQSLAEHVWVLCWFGPVWGCPGRLPPAQHRTLNRPGIIGGFFA